MQPNQLSQSSRLRPYCVAPDCGSSAPLSGRMRKSRPLALTTPPVLRSSILPPTASPCAQYSQPSSPHFSPLTRCCGLPSHEAVIQDFALVGPAVAVGVLGVENVGRTGDQNAVAPRSDAGGKAEVVEKHGRAVVAAVAVGIFQAADRAAVLAFAVDAARIVAHLDDPQLAVGSPSHGDRIDHQRLGRHQLDLKARPSVRHRQRQLGATSARGIARP